MTETIMDSLRLILEELRAIRILMDGGKKENCPAQFDDAEISCWDETGGI